MLQGGCLWCEVDHKVLWSRTRVWNLSYKGKASTFTLDWGVSCTEIVVDENKENTYSYRYYVRANIFVFANTIQLELLAKQGNIFLMDGNELHLKLDECHGKLDDIFWRCKEDPLKAKRMEEFIIQIGIKISLTVKNVFGLFGFDYFYRLKCDYMLG